MSSGMWASFWKGYFNAMKEATTLIPNLFKFWKWDWEAIGEITLGATIGVIIVLAFMFGFWAGLR